MPQKNHQNQINTAIEARLRKNFSEPDFRALELWLGEDEEERLDRCDSEARMTKMEDEVFNAYCALSSNSSWQQEDVASYKWGVVLSQYLDKSVMSVLTHLVMECGFRGAEQSHGVRGCDEELEVHSAAVLAGAGGEPVDEGD